MKRYIITRNDYPGQEVEVCYNETLVLQKIDFSNMPSFTPKHVHWLKANIPTVLSDPMVQFMQLMDASDGKLHITETAFDVSFNTFWEAYNYKRHKKDAQKLYERLSYADKVRCIDSIKPYHIYRTKKGEWLQQMLPDTYISKREFETDWGKMK